MRPNKPFLTIIFYLVWYSLLAQSVLNGRVYDVATGQSLSNASLHLVGNPQESYRTNLYGHYVIKQGELNFAGIQFFNNSMIWEGDKMIEVQIFHLNGQLIFQESIKGGETYLFPKLDAGLYILMLIEGGNVSSFKMLADENKTIKVDRRGIFHKSIINSTNADTLSISREGYYSRKIVVPAKSKVKNIPMLKGQYEDLDFFNELIDPVAFDVISSDPARSNLGDIRQVKLIYDIKQDRLYYMNSKKYALHLNFAVNVLGFDKGHSAFNQTQYRENKERYLHLASLNYYPGIEKYALQFVAAVDMRCDQIQILYQKILNSSFIEKDQLAFFPIKTEWTACETMNLIDSDELYRGQEYQGLNLTSNYGYLKFVETQDVETQYLSRRDIVVSNGIPNDLPVVAGIITSDLQTPLSHINVLSHSRKTPNMALKNAWDNTELGLLKDKLVYLSVGSSSFEIREASVKEATDFWSLNEPSVVIRLSKNTNRSGLIDLEKAGFGDVSLIGGKAANFAEMLKVPSVRLATPEDAFAIPFYYYQEHFLQLGLDVLVNNLLNDEQFISDVVFRKSELTRIRDSILIAPLSQTLIDLVADRIDDFNRYKAYRFRSSTNAEDIESFSGAGLYSSFSAKKDNPQKTIEQAIKKVWASLWNFRAFEERTYFKIDHLSCAMGILVHRSFPDEDANGVLISKNLYNDNPGYIINAQYKEHSIVFPEPGIINDQMILFTWSINPFEKYMLEYLTFSNIPELNGKPSMKQNEVFMLGDLTTDLKKHFYYNVPHSCGCALKDFGLDIEFKVDSDVFERKVYIKQARLYN